MSGTTTFNFETFIGRYPEFINLTSDVAALFFGEAQLYFDNTGSGPAYDPTTQAALLNMLTAHITALNFGVNGQPPAPLVGRVATATEGSVSVSADMGGPKSGSESWYMQTRYGANYWQATAGQRFGFYSPGLQPGLVGYMPAYGGFGGPFLGGW